MRLWFVNTLDKNSSGRRTLKKHMTFKDFEDHMGGYEFSEYYKDQQTFFKNCLNRPRKYWDDFLNKNLSKEGKVLSIGSGQCVNEMFLVKKNII